MQRELICIAKGRGASWEAICLDLDIAVTGRSLAEVQETLQEAIVSYIQDAMAEEPAVRDRLLSRRTPFFARLAWAWPVLLTAMLPSARSEKQAQATYEYAVPCPA